ncbi:MAG: hypothetical protein COV32_02910 [Candidatus Yonathbacteria bacterium CG10_big_fil_rev_8_21_14_0_10_43_136]|uniref:Uncharacterized protein n=2 Tax=Parcubacteria group TaxID=1794811 RepID=A0A2M7Q582_9BACT|nr:MAG: hypothetical protein AUK15_01515 [Candidatus Nomurabacteria bacterium CG2_30_43_9]PIQ36120.1 MAG: hypothetical protein COW60_00350 [Candidatus Yonathbacteria bacterium CG17_big_fil_post_rev_8_21_14_2_50_43_9]PIR40513.1 MAG: hypothetical protein COV32_02910 [Candidatus Yonathbacteria bacterium CG10_big_fil_rev_8_21_14_0_10_43_136]PIX57526.1 MAG: hypothetical protein COZ48_00425 [Candidatus Yonathbacteria bacterium CG_4_10_14_3_um_filter_43_12]PIY58220.1 MAG: hypothetical protein COY98_03
MKLFSYTKYRPVIISFVIVIFLIVFSFGMRINSGEAIAPFGGQILNVMYCPCSANIAITVGPPAGGIFSYDGSGMMYAFYQIFRPGPWVLGTYIPGSKGCWQFVPNGCIPLILPIGTISTVGTSM